jgi:hypothetical protein
MFWTGPRRDIYYDLDGSLSGTNFDGTSRTSTTLMPYYPHNDIPGQCINSTTNPDKWDTSLLCGNTSIVRSVFLTNGIP